MMDTNFKLSVLEISLFLSGALVLGISIRSFIASRRTPNLEKQRRIKVTIRRSRMGIKISE